MDVKSTFVSYLLFPLLAAIMATVMIIFNKKNRLMSNRRLIVAVLLTGLTLGLPGFLGALGLNFMPWGYIFSQVLYLGLGVLAIWLLSKYYPDALEKKKGMVILLGLICCLLGIYLYKLSFNWMSDLDYGLLAGTAVFMFPVPLVFWWTYMAMLHIPSEIYSVWYYPERAQPIEMYDIDLSKTKVLEVELFKGVNDPSPLKVKVKAPPAMHFGEWFRTFIDDYNMKFPRAGVQHQSEDGEAFGWIFYLKPSFFKRKQFINPEISVEENQIKEQYTVFARRVTRLQHELGGEDRVVVL
jgi:hypothetical protein